MNKTNVLHKTVSSVLAAALALGWAGPSYDRGGQALAAANGAASDSRSHSLKTEQTSQTSGLEELEQKLRQVAQATGIPVPSAAPVRPARPGEESRRAGELVEGRAVVPAPMLTARLEEANLEELIQKAKQGDESQRLDAIPALGRVFDEIEVERIRLMVFQGGRRILPDLTPVVGMGAIGVLLEDVIGKGNREAIDLAAATTMRPATEVVMRVAGWNWWNRSGEGLRDGVRPEAQIPPMPEPITYNPGWPVAQTANDPVDGTGRTARGEPGGVNVYMVTPKFGIVFPDKVRAQNVIYAGRKADFTLNDPFGFIVERIAAANHLTPKDYEVLVLDREWHQDLIDEARQVGARPRAYGDGSLLASLYVAAAYPKKHIIVAGRVGATEAKMVAAPLLNVRYEDGGRIHGRFRIISENSRFVVEKHRTSDGAVYYLPKKVDGKPVKSKSLKDGPKLSLDEIGLLREVGFTDGEIDKIMKGELEWEMEELAPAAGDMFIAFLMDPISDKEGVPLYDLFQGVRGTQRIRQDFEKVGFDALELAADGIWLTRHRYPDRGLGLIAQQMHDQERVLRVLREIAVEDSDSDIQAAARQALQAFLPHALGRDFQRQAAYGIAGLAGLEEPALGVFPSIPAFLEHLKAVQPERLQRLQRLLSKEGTAPFLAADQGPGSTWGRSADSDGRQVAYRAAVQREGLTLSEDEMFFQLKALLAKVLSPHYFSAILLDHPSLQYIRNQEKLTGEPILSSQAAVLVRREGPWKEGDPLPEWYTSTQKPKYRLDPTTSATAIKADDAAAVKLLINWDKEDPMYNRYYLEEVYNPSARETVETQMPHVVEIVTPDPTKEDPRPVQTKGSHIVSAIEAIRQQPILPDIWKLEAPGRVKGLMAYPSAVDTLLALQANASPEEIRIALQGFPEPVRFEALEFIEGVRAIVEALTPSGRPALLLTAGVSGAEFEVQYALVTKFGGRETEGPFIGHLAGRGVWRAQLRLSDTRTFAPQDLGTATWQGVKEKMRKRLEEESVSYSVTRLQPITARYARRLEIPTAGVDRPAVPGTGLEEVEQALRDLGFVERFWSVEDVDLQRQARPILIDLSQDMRLDRLALALSMMMAKDNVPELDFRVVVPESRRQELLDHLNIAGKAHAFLAPRIVGYESENDLDDAKWEALGQLARRFGFDTGMELKQSGMLRVVSEWSANLAAELQAFFIEGGLNFVSDEAFDRWKALIEAA